MLPVAVQFCFPPTGHQEVAKKLIEEESCKVNTKDCFGNTPLHIAASKGDLQNIQALEKRGCDFTVSSINIFES